MRKKSIAREQTTSLIIRMNWFDFIDSNLVVNCYGVSSSFQKEREGWLARENCMRDRPTELPQKSRPPPLKFTSRDGREMIVRTRKSSARCLSREKQRLTPGPYLWYQSVPVQVQGKLPTACFNLFFSAYSKLGFCDCSAKLISRQSSSLCFPAFIIQILSQLQQMNINTINNIRVPQNRKYKWSEMQYIKNIPKEETFCQVRIVKYEQEIYALKVISKKKIDEGMFQEEYRRIQNQIRVLYLINHPNIVKLYFHQEREDDIMLLMEYGGTRLGGMIRRKLLEEREVSLLAYQILQGLKVVHENGYIHRDLSSENIVVSRQNKVKIVDFGFVDEVRGRTTYLGNLCYMAPEITGGDNYNYKVDIWSLGVVVYEMLHQDIPFLSRKNFDDKAFVQNRDNFKLNINSQISAEANQFIRKMIVLNPERRLDVRELLRHPFIRQHREGSSFDQSNQTQRIERKTQKNPQIIRCNTGKEVREEREIAAEEKELKRSIGQLFACLHNQKDILQEAIRNYQKVLQKEINAKIKKS